VQTFVAGKKSYFWGTGGKNVGKEVIKREGGEDRQVPILRKIYGEWVFTRKKKTNLRGERNQEQEWVIDKKGRHKLARER